MAVKSSPRSTVGNDWRKGMRSPNPGGRPKGIPNKINGALRDMILEALERRGGAEYLEDQSRENPAAFMALLGRILPRQIEGQLEGDVVIRVMTGVPRPKVDEVAES